MPSEGDLPWFWCGVSIETPPKRRRVPIQTGISQGNEALRQAAGSAGLARWGRGARDGAGQRELDLELCPSGGAWLVADFASVFDHDAIDDGQT